MTLVRLVYGIVTDVYARTIAGTRCGVVPLVTPPVWQGNRWYMQAPWLQLAVGVTTLVLWPYGNRCFLQAPCLQPSAILVPLNNTPHLVLPPYGNVTGTVRWLQRTCNALCSKQSL